ncbi:MAG: type II secretion system protein GspK [Gammaproteobacteria bacterium]|nr:type II secretion system protein GspK [Gammaproteobacteria bacterium]
MNARGFVLVATLWVLAGLAALATYIDSMVATDLDRTHLYRQSILDELHRRGTEATLLYLLSTGRMSHRGLVLEEEQRFLEAFDDPELPPGDGELTMAGETYAGLGRMRFALQDERGLAHVNIPSSPMLGAVLERAGIAPGDVARILPRIGDYVDVDNQLTLNGAESFDYREQGLPPPANWFMAGPMELKKVLGVGRLISPEQWQRLSPLLSVRGAGIYNFNTMHPQVLEALLDLDSDGVREILEARAERPITRFSQIAMLTGRYPGIDEESIVMLPSPYVRIAIWPAGGARKSVAGFSLTPGGAAPWRTEYRYSELVLEHGPELPQKAATPLL